MERDLKKEVDALSMTMHRMHDDLRALQLFSRAVVLSTLPDAEARTRIALAMDLLLASETDATRELGFKLNLPAPAAHSMNAGFEVACRKLRSWLVEDKG